jgi:hypothetical protein
MSEKGGTYLCRHLSMHMASTTNQWLPNGKNISVNFFQKKKNISVNLYIKQPFKLWAALATPAIHSK